MRKTLSLALACLILCLLVASCSGPQTGPDAQATAIAVAVEATLAVQAPALITVVVTASPPAEPTATLAPTLPPTATPPPTPTPRAVPTSEPMADTNSVRIHVEADGSGDYPTLEAALLAAPEGATVTLGPGSYHLAKALSLDKTVGIQGSAMEETEIVSADPQFVLRFEGEGSFRAESITFRHEGPEPANVVMIRAGEAEFFFCRFTGGVYTEEAGYGGIGLFLGGSTKGSVFYSEADGNHGEGILVGESADVVVEQSRSLDNGGCGLTYFGQTAGVARSNDFSGNGLHGACILDDAQPLLEGNTCRYNSGSGIVYFDEAGGTAQNNDCSLNDHHGIAVQEQARPALQSNSCYANGEADIAFFDSAGGSAHANRCSLDAPSGIYVAETASPSLSANLCRLEGAVAGASSAGASPGPRYNPDYLEGRGPVCFNRPQPAVEREWQVGANPIVVIDESVELPLRNKWGENDEVYEVLARVVAPDESQSTATTTLKGAEDAVLVYPDDFGDANTGTRGTYTVIWEVEGGFIACDGFVVAGGASW